MSSRYSASAPAACARYTFLCPPTLSHLFSLFPISLNVIHRHHHCPVRMRFRPSRHKSLALFPGLAGRRRSKITWRRSKSFQIFNLHPHPQSSPIASHTRSSPILARQKKQPPDRKTSPQQQSSSYMQIMKIRLSTGGWEGVIQEAQETDTGAFEDTNNAYKMFFLRSNFANRSL